MKKISPHKNASACRLKPVETGLFAVCLCLLAGACNNDSIQRYDDENGGETALRFSTGVDSLASGIPPETKGVDQVKLSPNTIAGTTFPLDRTLGLFINSAAGAEIYPGSGDNLKATVQSPKWTYAKKDGTPINSLTCKVGKNIQIISYWPWNPAASASAVPFDFTDISLPPKKQKDLLYNKPGNQNAKVAATGSIALAFSRAYSMITVKIKKSSTASNVAVNAVGIVNQATYGWIKNKGSVNPATGALNDGAQAGNIICKGQNDVLATDSRCVYEFLVPPFMSKDIRDDQIALFVTATVTHGTSAGKTKNSLYPLKRIHLSSTGTVADKKYGFIQGADNVYELEYDSDNMEVNLLDWTYINVNAKNIGDPLAAYSSWTFDYDDIFDESFLDNTEAYKPYPSSNHIYDGYLLDLDRNNNGSSVKWSPHAAGVPDPFLDMWKHEKPVSPILFALKDVVDGSVPWRTPDGIMRARQLCNSYREGGFTDWRLPRISEWYMFTKIMQSQYIKMNFPGDHGGTRISEYPYWSGTEMRFEDGHAEVIFCKLTTVPLPTLIKMDCGTLSPGNYAKVRCVRGT